MQVNRVTQSSFNQKRPNFTANFYTGKYMPGFDSAYYRGLSRIAEGIKDNHFTIFMKDDIIPDTHNSRDYIRKVSFSLHEDGGILPLKAKQLKAKVEFLYKEGERIFLDFTDGRSVKEFGEQVEELLKSFNS